MYKLYGNNLCLDSYETMDEAMEDMIEYIEIEKAMYGLSDVKYDIMYDIEQ